MSSDLTRQTLLSNENYSHMDEDLQAAQQVPLPPPRPPVRYREEEDLIDYSDEEIENMPVASNSEAQPGTASMANTEDEVMEEDNSVPAARLNTASTAEAKNENTVASNSGTQPGTASMANTEDEVMEEASSVPGAQLNTASTAEAKNENTVASNSGTQPGTASMANTEDEVMEEASSVPAARLNTASTAEAEDGDIERLSSELRRVSTLQTKGQAASSSIAAGEHHFSRAFESIAKSNAGILPGSINPFNTLQEPVRASGPPSLQQALAFGRKMVLERERVERERLKRLRSPSPDSSRPNKHARSEPEDVDMDETAPQPFNFREIVDPKSSSQCLIKAGNHPWFGRTHDEPNVKLPNYKVNIHVLGGRLGMPMIKLCFSMCKKEYLKKTPDKSVKEDAFHKFWCIWQPGLILDPSHPQYQIGDLEISHHLKPNDKVEMPKVLMEDKTGILQRVVGVSFRSHAVTLEGSDREAVKYMDPNLLNTFNCVRLQPCKVTVWYIAPGGVEYHITKTLNHFQNALENHLPPLHQYLTPPTWELNADLKLTPIRHFQGGMYCKYPEVNRIEDDTQEPRSFHVLQPKLHFQSDLEFEIYYSVGVIREYQWQRGRIAHMSQRPHKIFLLKTFRYPTVRSQLKLTKAQSKFRNSYYGYVRMTPNELGLVESAPPEGTIFTLDWANKQGGNGTHLVSPKEEQWFGKVCGAKSDTLARLGAHFCLILTKPSNARGQKAYSTLDRVKEKLPKAYLRHIFNDTPAEREVMAVRDFCKTSRDDLSLLRLSAVADPHHGIAEYTNLCGGPGGQEENKATYLARLAEKRKIFNEGQMKVMEGVDSVVNKLMLVQGPPGSGKTKTVSHVVDLLIEVGHKILLTCPSNGAVDENTRKLWEVLPKDKKVLRLEIITIDRDNTFGRKEGDYILPDAPLPSRQSHVNDWEQDPMYITMLAQLMTAEIVIGHESADVDRFVEGSQALKSDYAAIYERNEKRHDFPRGMSMAFRIWEMLQADIKASRDFEYEDTGMNRAIARSQGTLETPHDPSLRYRQLIERYNSLEGLMSREEFNELRYEYEGQVARVIRDADIILTTCNNSGNEIIRDTFKPSVLIVDEAAQATLPATLVPMTAYSDWMAVILVGDQAQLQPTITSRDANEFEANLKISFFTHVIQKGHKPFLLNIQYRMSPEISRFPSLQFYNKELLDAESVKQDNPIRQKVRSVSSRDYGIKGGRTGKGSEYWMIDVARGVSRREENGTSLQNYANASVIIELMRKLVKEGVPKAVIQVLSFYKGQIKTIFKTADDVPELDDLGGVSTVDIFQGQEARVVILDLVVAHQRTGKQTEALDQVYDVATQHVRNPNRLCVGLTRARDGLIVVANANAMGKNGSHSTEGGRTLGSLLANAKERNLLYIDKYTLDTHPIAKEKMEMDNEYRKQVAAELDIDEHLAFIENMVRTKHLLSKKSIPVTQQRPTTYRSGGKKPTTLPHIPKSLQAKMPPPANPKPKPKWVEKNKKQPKYDNDLRWKQGLQQSEPSTPHRQSRVSNDNGKQGEENPEMTDSMQQVQSPEELQEGKGKQRMKSPEETDSRQQDQSSEHGSEEGETRDPHMASTASGITGPLEQDQPMETVSENREIPDLPTASGSNVTSQGTQPPRSNPESPAQQGTQMRAEDPLQTRSGRDDRAGQPGGGGGDGPENPVMLYIPPHRAGNSHGGGAGGGATGGGGNRRGGATGGGGNRRGGPSSSGRA